VLLIRPESLAGPSFQLSFAAVTAIVALHEHPRIRKLFARRDEGPVRRGLRIVLALLVTGVAVELALAPIALFHFHQAGVLGALANIVAIPLTTFVIMPLEAAGLLLDIAGLGAPAWWLAGQALGFLLWIAHTVAATPGAVALLPTMPPGAFALMVCGGLWIALWRTRVRRLGLLPCAAGAAWALATPPPDLIVTGDGRHLAIRRADGGLAILRDRAGDYVREMLSEVSGFDGTLAALSDLPEARCSRDLCVADIHRGGRSWRVLATRSNDLVPWPEMIAACAAADIVVADRRLPVACTPRWLKIDRALLRRTGGLTVTFGRRPSVSTVAQRVGNHPWKEATPRSIQWKFRKPAPAASRPGH
jgi:competence protein ComEC